MKINLSNINYNIQNKMYIDNINKLIVAPFCDLLDRKCELISNDILQNDLIVVHHALTLFLACIFPKFR